MEINEIMNRLSQSQQAAAEGIKTASAQRTVNTANALRESLRATLSTVETEKTASAAESDTTASLLKIAEDLTHAEEEVMAKQAALYGAAMCDGFMNRFNQYEQAAASVPAEKTASVKVPESFEKFAAENPELTQEAYELGYTAKMAELQKTAEEEFNAGYEDTMNEVHKIASEAYKSGADQLNQILQQAR